MKLSRRSFLKSILSSIIFLAANPFKDIFANSSIPKSKSIPDLVGVKGGSAAQMFEVGISALGGMEKFVKKGQTVLVKPNIGWNRTPTEAANTNPGLVGKIVAHAYKAGASKVVVFDNTCNEMNACYSNSGIKGAVESNNGVMLPSNDEKYYSEVPIPKAKIIKKVKVHKSFMESDVVINVPVLKHHVSTKMTAALKNFMGVIWDRRFWHKEGLDQTIGEFSLLRKADLTVIDAYTIMYKNGPRGFSPDDLKIKKMQILSPDGVLADAAASKILDLNPENLPYLKVAHNLELGNMKLKNANIKRISLAK